MVTPFQRTIFSAVVFSLAHAAVPAYAQAPQKGPLPIQLKITLSILPPAAAVKIGGNCLSDSKHNQVQIRVTTPGTQSYALSAVLDANGNFSVQFTHTAATGTYQVDAVAPDNVGRAHATFTVKMGKQIADDAANTVSSLISSASSLSDAVQEKLNSTPVSPPQQQALSNLKQLQNKLQESPQHIQQLQQALDEVQSETSKDPNLQAAFQPLWTDVAKWESQATAEEAEVRSQLQASKNGAEVCGMLNSAIEGLNSMVFLLNFVGDLNSILDGYANEALRPAVIAQLMPSGTLTSNEQSLLTLAWSGWNRAKDGLKAYFGTSHGSASGTQASLMSMGTSLLSLLGSTAFQTYCKKFEGPMQAIFHVQFTKDAIWDYDIQLSGKLLLMYPASAGKTAHLTGYFEGSASQFNLHEDLVSMLRRDMHPNVYARKPFTPPTLDYQKAIAGLQHAGLDPGEPVEMLTEPAFFKIPVEGDLVDKNVTLRIQPAQKDFSDLIKGRVLYVLVDYVTLVPYVIWFDMPFQNAYFILTRSIGFTSHWQVAMSGKNMLLQRAFDRDYKSPQGDFWITWKTNVKACNPGCFP